MQRKTSLGIVLLLSAVLPIVVVAYSTGPPAARTGACTNAACTQKELTCTECHGTTANSGPGNVRITAPASYTSGGTVPITVTVSDPNARRWGFELSARTQSAQQAGTLLTGSDGFTQVISEAGIQYIEHTLSGTRSGTASGAGGVSFNFQWRAPDVSAGPVVFYAAANAANNNFNNDPGDRIYTSSATAQPQAPPGPTPSISQGGVVNNASFALHPAPIAPGTIIAIFGTNMTAGGVTVDDTSLGPDGKVVTTLGGASVKINGIAAPMLRAFPTQLVAQMPTEITSVGTASIEATVGDQTSAAVTFNTDALAPGIFAINAQGTGQGAVLLSNTNILAAPVGSISGRTTRPARRGEFITIFSTGLGQVTPAIATGALAASHTTVASATVAIGDLTVNAAFSGLSPGFAGLYQVDVQLPANATLGASVPLRINIGGKQSNTVTIAIDAAATSTGSSNPAPTIASLSPASLDAGAPAQTLAINGTGFVAASTATFNGAPKTVTFVSETQLTIQLTAGDLQQAGSSTVIVTNPPPGGGASAVVILSVLSPPPLPTDDYYY